MKITENDIASTEIFGNLNGKPVKLLVTRGGLNLAVGADKKGEETVLGAASHRAILSYTVEQRYPDFQPMMMKSEGKKFVADSHSHFLSEDLRKSGHDIYSVQNGNSIDFFITKLNVKTGLAKAVIERGAVLVKSCEILPEFLKSLSSAISEKALSLGCKKVKF